MTFPSGEISNPTLDLAKSTGIEKQKKIDNLKKDELEEPIQLPKLKKVGVSKYIYMAIILVVLVLSLFLVYNKGMVAGGRKACLNSNSRLIEGFRCDFRCSELPTLNFGESDEETETL